MSPSRRASGDRETVHHTPRRITVSCWLADGCRGKFNMIVAEGIEPFLPAEEYMDRDENENELKQVHSSLRPAPLRCALFHVLALCCAVAFTACFHRGRTRC